MNIQDANFIMFALICVVTAFYVLSEMLLILEEKGSIFFMLFVIITTPIATSFHMGLIGMVALALLTWFNYYDLNSESHDTDINIDININIKSRDSAVTN